VRDSVHNGGAEARHGGNLVRQRPRAGLPPEQLLDASALVGGPRAAGRRCGGLLRKRWGPEQGRPLALRELSRRELQRLARGDRRRPMASDPAGVLPGNGGRRAVTWASQRRRRRRATSWLPTPGFAGLPPAPLGLLGGSWQSCPCPLGARSGRRGKGGRAVTVNDAIWITNPTTHGPALESRSLEPLLERFCLVIVD